MSFPSASASIHSLDDGLHNPKGCCQDRLLYIVFLVDVAILLLTAPLGLFAQPAQEGSVIEADLGLTDWSAFAHGRLALHDVHVTGTRFLRLHFTDIADPGTPDYSVVIMNYRGDTVFTYDKKTFDARPSFWTGIITGDTALVEVRAPQAPMKLKFILKEYAFWQPIPQIKSVYKNEFQPIADYRTDATIMRVARPVAKLAFFRNGFPDACTGFMISDDLLMTNAHCIDDQETCDNTVAIFGYEVQPTGDVNDGDQYHCVEYKKSNYAYDWSVLRIEGNPGAASRWGHLALAPLAKDELHPGEAAFIIQHPGGNPKEISKKDCAVQTPDAEGRGLEQTDFGHHCDTETGSSGSPVFDGSGRVIGLHHLPYSAGRWAKENRAVKSSRQFYDMVKEYLPPQ